jgi:nitrate reductase NapE component
MLGIGPDRLGNLKFEMITFELFDHCRLGFICNLGFETWVNQIDEV